MDSLPQVADDFFLQLIGISRDAFLEMLKCSGKNCDKFGAMMSTYISLGNSKRLNHRMAFVRHVPCS